MYPTIEKRAPAKINLSLRVLGKRDDGFHEVVTRMLPLELADVVKVEQLPGEAEGIIDFICSDATLPGGPENLAVRAAMSLAEKVDGLPALRISLTKNIPHGAGLGGGSSDAAATLMCINELLRLGLSLEELAEIGGRIGSDVPFFLYGCACDATGRGEVVRPVEEFKWDRPILLVKLPFGVPTPWAYQRWGQSREIPGIPYAPQNVDGQELVNDLERPVFEKHLILAELKRWFLEQAEVAGALMSGSGSTLFAVLKERRDAADLEEKLRHRAGDECWIWTGGI